MYSGRTKALLLLAIFLGSFAFFLFLQSKPVFPDPDSFYHVKMAQLVAQQGVVQHFPWLTYTGLTTYFTDQHYLYHVFLAPFVTLVSDPIAGAKFATALINAGLIALFAAFLMRFRVKLWPVVIGILLVTNPFLFRIDLVKAPAMSLFMLFLGLWFLFSGKRWWLALIGFLYAWTYGGFLLLSLSAAVYAMVSVMHGWHRRSFFFSLWDRRKGSHFKTAFLTEPAVKLFFFAFGGSVLGVVLNPYFPKNLRFFWEQLVQIGIVNFQHVVNVGGEWRPYDFLSLVTNDVFVSIVVLLALVGLVITHKKQSTESWTFFVLTALFFALTLKSRRYVEVYVPLAVFFAAFVSRDVFAGVSLRKLVQRLFDLLSRRLVTSVLLMLYFALTSLFIIFRDTGQLIKDLHNGIPSDSFRGAATWLMANTPQNSIVVHSDWDEFPTLFYQDSWNRYIVGLDPTFMYQYDRTLYQRWADLTSGSRSSDAVQIITQDLKSSIVLVAKDHPSFLRTMEAQPAFSQVYEDADAVIFRLRDTTLAPPL